MSINSTTSWRNRLSRFPRTEFISTTSQAPARTLAGLDDRTDEFEVVVSLGLSLGLG